MGKKPRGKLSGVNAIKPFYSSLTLRENKLDNLRWPFFQIKVSLMSSNTWGITRRRLLKTPVLMKIICLVIDVTPFYRDCQAILNVLVLSWGA